MSLPRGDAIPPAGLLITALIDSDHARLVSRYRIVFAVAVPGCAALPIDGAVLRSVVDCVAAHRELAVDLDSADAVAPKGVSAAGFVVRSSVVVLGVVVAGLDYGAAIPLVAVVHLGVAAHQLAVLPAGVVFGCHYCAAVLAPAAARHPDVVVLARAAAAPVAAAAAVPTGDVARRVPDPGADDLHSCRLCWSC